MSSVFVLAGGRRSATLLGRSAARGFALKLVYLSNRHLQHEVYWRNMTPPLERALSGIPDVTIVAPPPLRRPTFRADRPAWLASIRVVRQADAVLWMQMHLRPPLPIWGLAYARPLTMRTVIVLDAWRQHLDNLALVVERQHIRRCFVFYRQAADMLAYRYPHLGFSWLPVCVDTGVFRDVGKKRDIDFFWIEGATRHCMKHSSTIAPSGGSRTGIRCMSTILQRARNSAISFPARATSSRHHPI